MTPRGSARLATQPGRKSQPYPLTLIDLEAVITAVRVGSVKATAEELDLAPQAVIRRLRKLEQRVAIHLFADLPATVDLTPAGNKMLPLALAAYEHLVALEAFVEKHAEPELAADARHRAL